MRLNSKWKKVLLALAVIPLSACNLSHLKGGSGSSSNSGGRPSSATTAFSPSNDARKDLGDALRKLKTAYPYRLTETMSATANGQTAMPESARVVEFEGPDRLHMKWTGGPTGEVESISIGASHYWFANGKWTEGTVPSSKGVNRSEDLANKFAEMVKEVKYLRPETISGLPCFAYSYTVETNLGGQSYTGTGKAWISAVDGLPRQSDSEFKVSTYANKSHIVYDYNVNVKVEKPVL